MKTSHFVLGIVVVILGVGLGILAFSWTGRSCATSAAEAFIFDVPTCDDLATQILAVGAGGLVFIIIGVVVLATGREKDIPTIPAPPQPSPPVSERVVPQLVCPTCGARYGSEAEFCQKDGTRLLAS